MKRRNTKLLLFSIGYHRNHAHYRRDNEKHEKIEPQIVKAAAFHTNALHDVDKNSGSAKSKRNIVPTLPSN